MFDSRGCDTTTRRSHLGKQMEAGREACAGGDKVRATVITQRLHETPLKAEGREDFRDYIFKVFSKYFLYISPWLKFFFPHCAQADTRSAHTQKKAKRTFWSVHNRWAAHEKGDRSPFCSLPTQTKYSPGMQANHEHSCSPLGSAERRASRTSHEDCERRLSQSKSCGKVS